MKTKQAIFVYVGGFLLLASLCGFFLIQTFHVSSAEVTQQAYVQPETFGANSHDYVDDKAAIQQAIDYAQTQKIGKVKLTGGGEYLLQSGIVIKKGVELEMDNNTKLTIDGNFRAIELQNDASLTDGFIMVANTSFASEVIYLDGKYKFTSWDRARVRGVTIVNAANTYKGTAVSLYAGGDGHYISYVKFSELKITGFATAIKLQAVKPVTGMAWVNANYFNNITLDANIKGIDLIGGQTVPNETSGNTFTDFQMQTESNTTALISVTGQDNVFHGMMWDITKSPTAQPVVVTANAVGTKLDINLAKSKINDKGVYTQITTPYPN